MTHAEAVALASAEVGSASPRIAPPVPARSDVAGFRETAESLDITLMPWQETAARYLTATGPDGTALYKEVAIVVARQNGKTLLMRPYIIRALKAGKRILHIAQTRELPRDMFGMIGAELPESLFLKRRGKAGKMYTVWPRFGAGSEEILLANGGSYRIAAANRGGARGRTNDIVIIDELREMETDEVIAAAEPTLLTSPDPQMVYLSNAGTDASVILNSVRERAGKDPNLAYLEWSAPPETPADDLAGWMAANPCIGHKPGVLDALRRAYERHALAGTMATFETENLCRWVKTMRESLITPAQWAAAEADALPRGRRAYMGVSMDPDGTRASAAIAWQMADGNIALQLVADVVGNPVNTADLGVRMREEVTRRRIAKVAYDPMTDAELAKFFAATESVSGLKWANASAQFVNLVAADKLRWKDSASVGDDLTWTARKEHDESGSFTAVRANDARPITASLAAIRAVWLASGPRPPAPRVY